MAMFSGYKAALEEYWHRTSIDNTFKFVTDHKKELKLSHACSCLSIGPGPGDLDVHIIRTLMPELQQYWAVERDPDIFVELHEKIGKVVAGRPHMETHFYLGNAVEWEGPSQKVDVILCCHVLYYIQDVPRFLQKCKSWLTPGGCIWIMQSDCGEFFKQLANYFSSDDGSMHAPPLREIVNQMNFRSVEQYGFQHTTNLSIPNKAFVSFCLNREALPQDEEIFQTMLNKEFSDREDYVDDNFVLMCRI